MDEAMNTTRSERKATNKAAHAIRRAATDADYREAKQAGQSLTWREVWDTYAAIDAATVIATMGKPADVKPAKPKAKRKAPAHIAAMSAEYRLALAAWTTGLEEAMAGGSRNGRPARGEKYTDEERDYREANPCPVWAEWLKAMSADARALAELEAVAA